MSFIVDIPVINNTLVNPQLIDLRKKFILNEVELLRRDYELYGLELSKELLDLYVKIVIVFNANITWDLKAVTHRAFFYNAQGVLSPHPVETFSVPAGIKFIDPITLSFMSFEEVKSFVTSHMIDTLAFRSKLKIFESSQNFMSPFSVMNYTQLEANYKALYGSLDSGYGSLSQSLMIYNRNRQYFYNFCHNPQLKARSFYNSVYKKVLEDFTLLRETKTNYSKIEIYQAPNSDLQTGVRAHPDWMLSHESLFSHYLGYKLYAEEKGFTDGRKTSISETFITLHQAHKSVMPDTSILTMEFAKKFKKALVEIDSSTKAIKKLYVFLNDNFKVKVILYGKTYTSSSRPDFLQAWTGLKVIEEGQYVETTNQSGTMASYIVITPFDSTYPAPYYLIDESYSSSNKGSHIIKNSMLEGLTVLRNGFLYHDLETNNEPEFIRFDDDALEELGMLVTKQVATFDILDDVKKGNIFKKTINNASTNYIPVLVDMIKTSEGDMPLVHPETGETTTWEALHAEMVLLSAFHYNNYLKMITPVLTSYSVKAQNFITKILQEMSQLSSTYAASEALRYQQERDMNDMEVKIQKLKSGIYIDDNGREYWRKLIPEEQKAVDEMLLKVETNLFQLEENERIQSLNNEYQAQADNQALLLNKEAEREAFILAAEMQEGVNEEWLRHNVKNLRAPSVQEIVNYADSTNLTLSESLVAWQNENPYYFFNEPLRVEIENLAIKLKKAEDFGAETLLQAKINEIEITKALKELFIIK